jgi:hypothetical protein
MVLPDGVHVVSCEGRPTVIGLYILFGGIAAGTVTLYDHISQRVNRKAHKH